MKYRAILFALAAAVALTACEDKLTEREKLDSRTVGQLDVQYAIGGEAKQALAFDHAYSRPVVDVVVSNDGLRWDLESDSDWCKVVPGEHRGSGSVMLEIEANESFEDRDPATLTFKAGDFRGFRIQVDQSAAAFIFSQPYFIAGNTGGSYHVNVTTLAGTDWSFEKADWLNVTRGAASPSGTGVVTTPLTVSCGTDYDESRLGAVNFSAGAERDAIHVWQFGTGDYTWKDGGIFLATGAPATFSLIAPHSIIGTVTVPAFASYTTETLEDDMDRITVTVEDFLSDASSSRDIPVSITLTNSTSTVVALPVIKQDYTPAGALMSAAGLQAFAEKVATGGSTAAWETDGWVTVIQDIDMTGVTNWQGIGTKDYPFVGKFDGKGHAIKNLKNSSNSIFNYCGKSENAAVTVKGLTIDKSSNFYCNLSNWTSNAAFGALVSRAVNTKIESCVNEAAVEFAGSSADDSPAYVGGILGLGSADVSVRGCRVSGCMISVSATAPSAYIGGVAGLAQTISGCSMSATLMHEGSFDDMYMGGIIGKVPGPGAVNGNSFSGTLTLKGSSSKNYVGGLYGAVPANGTFTFDSSADMSTAAGVINLDSFKAGSTSKVFAGGFLGYADAGVTLSFKGYEIQTRVFIDNSVDTAIDYMCVGEVLGGCSPEGKVKSVSFDNVTSQGLITVLFGPGNGSSSRTDRRLYGGVAGFVNGPATFTGCTNKGDVGVKKDGSSNNNETTSNNYNFDCIGGIVGYVVGGDASFSNCANTASVHGRYYVNNVSIAQTFSGDRGVQSIGGIIGAFNLYPSDSGKLTMSDCSNTGWLNVYRGWAGGIAGFVRNATLSQCTVRSSSAMDGAGFVQGGIAGCMAASAINNCTAKVDVTAGNGGNANEYGSNAGGIVGRSEGSVACSVNSCSYFGKISPVAASGTKPQNGGGLVGYAPSTTKVSDCSFGGTVNGVTVTQAKLNDLAIGAGGATATNTILWDGN
ncbi:MAG: BACON domain-containing protein [Bacteroidales bacterium]|nr:BACON domain-containing protein [Bacteroidales bacterium]